MRCLFNTLLALFLLSACNSDESAVFGELPQFWRLSGMTVSMTGQVLEELPYSETIQLNADSTFVKSRVENDIITTSTGIFSVINENGSLVVILDHITENEIIDDCSAGTLERFRLSGNDRLTGGSVACDGPGLTYIRTQFPF